jgi:hypothetical protein
MRSFSSSVDSVPELRPRGDLRQDSQVRDGLLSVTGPPNPSSIGFLCAPPRGLLSSPDVVRYFIHFLGRGNESGVGKQCRVVAAGHQPRPGDFEKNNQRRAAGDVCWPAHGTAMMGWPRCAVCPVPYITGPGALALAASHPIRSKVGSYGLGRKRTSRCSASCKANFRQQGNSLR